MEKNNLPREEMVCLNCAHHSYSTKFSDWLEAAVLFDRSGIHQCSRHGVKEKINEITGKKSIQVKTRSCVFELGAVCVQNCYWEPSAKWKKKKENLFYMISR